MVDGSVHVTNGGFNPVLTIMALAYPRRRAYRPSNERGAAHEGVADHRRARAAAGVC